MENQIELLRNEVFHFFLGNDWKKLSGLPTSDETSTKNILYDSFSGPRASPFVVKVARKSRNMKYRSIFIEAVL